ncbi:MAG: ATP-binding protein [Anaerovoracaceae bacterium]|nr:ATP-binding protein [Anaerovoracaceae bacterium]
MKENRYLEFKSEITNTFLKTVSAFANFGDGRILFGVGDNGDSIGFADPQKVCLDIENKINDSISPKPDFNLSVNDDNTVCLEVSKGRYTPYLYKGKAYRRSDTATIETDQGELRKLAIEGANLSFEELSYGNNLLTFEALETKMKKTMGIKALSEDVLRTLGFFTEDGEYNNAAAIFSDVNNFYGTDIARFGNSISEIMERETVSRVSVLEQYDKAVSYFKRYYQYEEISGIERKTVELIPEAAYREAVANALIHREWDINSHIRIAMFKDRIEINSPGGLPKGITRGEYLSSGISYLRNPILGNVFFRMHYIEMFGTGISRILELYRDAAVKPQFNITENVISVILPVLKTTYDVTEDEAKIISVLKGAYQLSSSEISKSLGFSRAKTIRLLNMLTEKNFVKCTGKGRGTKYQL